MGSKLKEEGGLGFRRPCGRAAHGVALDGGILPRKASRGWYENQDCCSHDVWRIHTGTFVLLTEPRYVPLSLIYNTYMHPTALPYAPTMLPLDVILPFEDAPTPTHAQNCDAARPNAWIPNRFPLHSPPCTP